MRKYFRPLLTILLICPLIFSASGTASAQATGDTLTLSLADAQRLALKNNPSLRVSELQFELARNTAEQSRQERIPQVYADINLQRNLILPTTPVPAKAFDPSAGDDELIHLRFTTQWTANTGINASVDLFNPARAGSIKRSAMEANLSESDRRLSENQLIFNVGSAFYACLIAEEQLRLAESDTLTRRTILDMHQKQFEKGRVNRGDLNLAKTELNNSRIFLEETRMIYDNSKGELLVLLGFSPEMRISLRLNDPAELIPAPAVALGDSIMGESIGLRRLGQELDINSLDSRIARRSFLPVISLNGYYGANYFDNRFEIFKGNHWYGNSFINVGVRLPLSDNLLRSKELARLKLQESLISQNIKAAENQRQQNIQEALRELRYHESQFARRKENLDMAEETTKISSLQYERGRLLVGDYYQQLYQYQKERAAYLESKYKLLVSKLSLEKAKTD